MELARRLNGYDTADGCESCIAEGTKQCRLNDDCTVSVCKRIAMDLYEIAGKEAEDATTVSAYNLLGDDYRDAIAFVREMGGFEAVKARTMPEGCEWPRFEDGEPVKLRDVIVPPEGGEPREVDCINHFKDCWYIGLVGASSEMLKRGERVKRPPVLAADGEPLEVGQTVYTLNDDRPYTVKKVETNRVSVNAGEGAYDVWKAPTYLTHQRPVLDADGVLCREGDEVWEVRSHRRREIVGTNYCDHRTGEPLILCDGDDAVPIPATCVTHTKPEQPDTWERIEEDATRMPGEYCERYGIYGDSFPQAEAMACDLVRRARKLAEGGVR